MIEVPAIVQSFDESVLRATFGKPEWAIPIFIVFTTVGAGWPLLWLVPFLFQRSTRATSLWLATSVWLTSSLVNVIKGLVGRARPCDAMGWCSALQIMAPGGHSFPSGHAAGSFAFAGFVAVRVPRWTLVACIYAAIVAWSRCALGVHYPSDVLAGSVLGTMIGVLVGNISRPLHDVPQV
ncbi:MAG: phosphatase PAP2 family protein [Byssovorax sp.]